MATPNFMQILKQSSKASATEKEEKKPLPAFLIPKKETSSEKKVDEKVEAESVISENVANESVAVTESVSAETEKNEEPKTAESSEETKQVEETKPIEETKVDLVEAVKEVDVEVEKAEEVKAEEPQKKKRGRKKSKAPVAVSNFDEELDDIHVIEYEKAIELIASKIVDPKWESLKQDICEKLNAIMITSDMNEARLKECVAQLNEIYQMVWFEYQGVKSRYERLASKEPEGLIKITKKLNSGDGTNAESRERAGIAACMNYRDPESGNVINLYDLFNIVSEHYIFLDSVIKNIEFKKSILVTMNGALKIEADLTK